MPVGWAAAIGAVATVGAGMMQSNAAKDAARTQRAGAADASAVQQHMFDVSNAQQQPFLQTGYGANDTLNRLLGLAPTGGSSANTAAAARGWDSSNGRLVGNTYLPPDVQTNDLGHGYYDVSYGGNHVGTLRPGGANGIFNNDTGWQMPKPTAPGGTAPVGGDGYSPDNTGLPTGYLTQTFGPQQFMQGIDPGYQWRLQQGNQATANTLAAGSGSLSGPAIKALMDYNQGAASQEYGNAFDRFQTQQGNIFQRLTSLSQLGQNAAANVGAQGIQTGANIGANITGAANASAAGQIGSANAIGSALNDIGAYAYLYSKKNGGTVDSSSMPKVP